MYPLLSDVAWTRKKKSVSNSQFRRNSKEIIQTAKALNKQ